MLVPKHLTLHHACCRHGVCSERLGHNALQRGNLGEETGQRGQWMEPAQGNRSLRASRGKDTGTNTLVIEMDHGHLQRIMWMHPSWSKEWQQVFEELWFMGPAVLGSASLFGTLQLGLSHVDKHWVKITRFSCMII